MPWINREAHAIYEGYAQHNQVLTRKNTDLALERDGLRTSLEACMKGEDGMIPVWKTVTTPEGWRHIALGLAIRFISTQDSPAYRRADAVTIAQGFEAYLTGATPPPPAAVSEPAEEPPF
jgi:hypothetical protein